MRNVMWSTVLIAVLCMIVPGTVPAEGSGKGSSEELKKSARDTLKAAKELAEKQKLAYQQKMQTELDAAASRLNQLKQKAATAKGDALTKLNAAIADLEKKHKAAQQKLGEVKSSGVQTWSKIKSALDGAVNDLKSAYQGLADQVK